MGIKFGGGGCCSGCLSVLFLIYLAFYLVKDIDFSRYYRYYSARVTSLYHRFFDDLPQVPHKKNSRRLVP